MWRYISKRLLLMIPVLIGVAFLIFSLMYLVPGDPAAMALGESATPEAKFAWREQYGLNDGFWVQFYNWVKGIVTRFDFGTSYQTGQSITQTLMERFPNTFLLAVLGTLCGSGLGLVMGILAANKQGTFVDSLIRVLSMLFISIPQFCVGLLMMLFFGIQLGWLPISGWYGAKYWIMPVVCVGIGQTASVARMTRSSVLECIRQDYVRTARAKGQTEQKITRHHVLRNALIPILTSIGIFFGLSIGGIVLVETIFAVPGIGKTMLNAINARDYPLVRAGVLLIALSMAFVNLLVDIAYAAVNPQIKARYISSSAKRVKVKLDLGEPVGEDDSVMKKTEDAE